MFICLVRIIQDLGEGAVVMTSISTILVSNIVYYSYFLCSTVDCDEMSANKYQLTKLTLAAECSSSIALLR